MILNKLSAHLPFKEKSDSKLNMKPKKFSEGDLTYLNGQIDCIHLIIEYEYYNEYLESWVIHSFNSQTLSIVRHPEYRYGQVM